jgi:hypothetical protein
LKVFHLPPHLPGCPQNRDQKTENKPEQYIER